MTDKEKKAIVFSINENKRRQRIVDEAKSNNKFTEFQQDLQKKINNEEVLLNLIQKQKEEIKYKDQEIFELVNSDKGKLRAELELKKVRIQDLQNENNYLRALVEKKDKEISKLNKECFKIFDEMMNTEIERIKANKIIDELINIILKLKENSNEDCFIYREYMSIDDCVNTTCEKCIRNYVENKLNSSEQN
jgi:hypothetical protein